MSESILVGWPENKEHALALTPLLQYARRADRTRRADFQREFRRNTEEPSRRYETLMPTRSHLVLGRRFPQTSLPLMEYYIEYYSNLCEVDRLPNTKARATILKLKSHFARYGIPDQVINDNGLQFTSDEFADFSRTWDFEHLTSSPGNNKANGKAESGVKTVKRIQKKSIRTGISPYSTIETGPHKE